MTFINNKFYTKDLLTITESYCQRCYFQLNAYFLLHFTTIDTINYNKTPSSFPTLFDNICT